MAFSSPVFDASTFPRSDLKSAISSPLRSVGSSPSK